MLSTYTYPRYAHHRPAEIEHVQFAVYVFAIPV